jgi:hypothetical protein
MDRSLVYQNHSPLAHGRKKGINASNHNLARDALSRNIALQEASVRVFPTFTTNLHTLADWLLLNSNEFALN